MISLIQNELKKIFNILPLKIFVILKIFKELDLLKFDINYNENINVFHSPSNRAYPTFNRQILNTIEEGRLEI